jgi:hypothetical protein
MRGQLLLPAGLLALVFAGGCAIANATAPAATPSPISTDGRESTSSPASATPGVTASPGPSAEIEIVVTGGPHAGSYRAVASPGCDSAPAHNRFTVSYANDSAPGGFVAFHLVLRDAAVALQDESDDFVAEISVGGAGAGISYTIDPLNGAGSGSAFLETSPVDATLELSATAPDGAQLDLSVLCDFS